MQRIQGAEIKRCKEYKVQSLQGADNTISAENTRCREYKVAENTRCRAYKVRGIQGAEKIYNMNNFLCSRDYKINHDGFFFHINTK